MGPLELGALLITVLGYLDSWIAWSHSFHQAIKGCVLSLVTPRYKGVQPSAASALADLGSSIAKGQLLDVFITSMASYCIVHVHSLPFPLQKTCCASGF